MESPPPVLMANLGMADTLILMVLALVVFGPRRLPQIGRQIGKLMYEFRKASNDFKFQMEEELRAAEESDRRKKEEERLRALAPGALPAPSDVLAQVPALGPGAPMIDAPVPDGQFPTPNPYPEEARYPSHPSDEAPESKAEETVPLIQPPSTGEQVPAARRGSLAAQVEVPAESGVGEEILPSHLPPESISSLDSPAKGPSPADFEETRAHSAETPIVEPPAFPEQVVPHG